MNALDQLRAELRSAESVLAAEPGETKRRELLGEIEHLHESIGHQERIDAIEAKYRTAVCHGR